MTCKDCKEYENCKNREKSERIKKSKKCLEYKCFFNSKSDIEEANIIVKEAYIIASNMYKHSWGRIYGKVYLKDEVFSIVYAFNIALNIIRFIKKSKDYDKAIKKETKKIWHYFFKWKRFEVNWLHERNTVLGILYYILAFDKDITKEHLELIEKRAKRIGLIPHKKVMIFFNDFKVAVDEKKNKNVQESEPVNKFKKTGDLENAYQDYKTLLTQDSINDNGNDTPHTKAHATDQDDLTQRRKKKYAQDCFKKIFDDRLDMDKIEVGVKYILGQKNYDNTFIFNKQKHWYLVHRWFIEIKFIKKEKSGKIFREWCYCLFDKKSTEYDFDAARKIIKNFPSMWEPTDNHLDFKEVIQLLQTVFAKEKRADYQLNKENYIDWELNRQKLLAELKSKNN